MSQVVVRNDQRGTTLGTSVAVADTWLARLRGLLGRPELRAGQGLLLQPCNAVHMLGMRYPIDVVFTDRSGVVIAVYSGLMPRRRTRLHRAAHVAVELPAGTLDASGTVVGDQLRWTHAEPPGKELAG